MHASSSSRLETPIAPRLMLLVARLSRVFAPDGADMLPAELRRLPDRLLLDVGVDPRTLPPGLSGVVTPPDLLRSPRAMTDFLATTVR